MSFERPCTNCFGRLFSYCAMRMQHRLSRTLRCHRMHDEINSATYKHGIQFSKCNISIRSSSRLPVSRQNPNWVTISDVHRNCLEIWVVLLHGMTLWWQPGCRYMNGSPERSSDQGWLFLQDGSMFFQSHHSESESVCIIWVSNELTLSPRRGCKALRDDKIAFPHFINRYNRNLTWQKIFQGWFFNFSLRA